MISIREKRNETILIQNNKLIYGLSINTCLLFFTFVGIFNILKNNIVKVYLDAGTIAIGYFLFRCFSKFKKKSFIKINSEKLEILSASKRRTDRFLLRRNMEAFQKMGRNSDRHHAECQRPTDE